MRKSDIETEDTPIQFSSEENGRHSEEKIAPSKQSPKHGHARATQFWQSTRIVRETQHSAMAPLCGNLADGAHTTTNQQEK